MENERLTRKEAIARLKSRGLSLFWYDLIDSTNDEAKRRAPSSGLPAVIVADAQSAGRGRMGRSFFSPQGTGLYLSYLTDKASPEATVGLTAAAAVAVVRAIRRTTGLATEIKWVNDILLDGKKVAGILAERFSAEGRLFTVVGIGINLTTPKGGFPEELQRKAGVLDVPTLSREALATALSGELDALIQALPDRSFMEEYRSCSAVLGHCVRYMINGVSCQGEAVRIDDDGALAVRLADSREELLVSGEISLSFEIGGAEYHGRTE